MASQELSVISRRSGLLDAIRQRNRAEIIAKRRGEICRANLDQRDLAPVPEVAVRLRSHPPARRPNRSRTEPINLLGTQDGRDLDLIGLDGLRSWSAFKIGDEPRLNLQRKIENSGADFRARFSLGVRLRQYAQPLRKGESILIRKSFARPCFRGAQFYRDYDERRTRYRGSCAPHVPPS